MTTMPQRPGQHKHPPRLLALFVCAYAWLACGTPVPAQLTLPPTDLQLILTAESTRFVLGEPIYVTVTLRNVGSATTEVFHVLDPKAGAIRVSIETEGRPRRVFLPLSLVDVDKGVKPLAAGQELAAVIPIFFGALQWTFPQAGTYIVTATYRHGHTAHGYPIRSNSISLSVSSGDGASRLLMESSPTGEQAGKFLVWQQGDHLHQGLDRLKRWSRPFPIHLSPTTYDWRWAIT